MQIVYQLVPERIIAHSIIRQPSAHQSGSFSGHLCLGMFSKIYHSRPKDSSKRRNRSQCCNEPTHLPDLFGTHQSTHPAPWTFSPRAGNIHFELLLSVIVRLIVRQFARQFVTEKIGVFCCIIRILQNNWGGLT